MPHIIWHVETGFCFDPDSSAAEAARYVQDRLGRSLEIPPALLLDLETCPAWALLWVTFTREDALRYGDAEDVKELRLDIPAYVIATDHAGGFLLFFPDDLTEPTGAAAMADHFEDDPAVGDLLPTPPRTAEIEDEEQKRRAARGGGDMGNPAHANLGANIRPEVGSGPAGLETYTTQKSADYRAAPEEMAITEYFRSRLAEAGRSANQPTLTLEAIAADPWNAVELPIPANADKELLTAARSAAEYSMEGEHHLMMEARAGRNTEHWSEELHAAGIPQPDAHEYNEGRWFQAETRLGEINEALDKIDGRGVYAEGARPIDAPPITNAQHDLYLKTLQLFDPDESVYAAMAEEKGENFESRAFPPVEEALRALLPDSEGVPYPWPQTFGEVLQHIEQGRTAPEAFREAVAAGFENGDREAVRAAYEDARQSAPDAPTQQVNDASTKRQEAERAARSGEESPTYGYAAEIAQGILAARGHEPEPTGVFAGVHYRLEQDIAALGLKPTAPREVDPYTVEDWLGEDRQDSAWGESPYDSAARRDAEVGGHQAKPATNVPNEPEYRPHGPDYLAYADLQIPWNAVAMPLHPDSDPLLREGALYAACYCALGEHQLLRATRSGEYSPPLYDPDTAGHAKHEGIEASASWAEMAVEKMLIYNYRDIETLRSTESHFADIAESRGVNLDNPQYEVLNYRAEAVGDLAERLEERAAALALIDERTLDPVRQQENDASTKRQEAERAARSGDSVSSDVEASVSDYFKNRLSEAKAEREAEGADLVTTQDHGEGKTPGGGGGRGLF